MVWWSEGLEVWGSGGLGTTEGGQDSCGASETCSDARKLFLFRGSRCLSSSEAEPERSEDSAEVQVQSSSVSDIHLKFTVKLLF